MLGGAQRLTGMNDIYITSCQPSASKLSAALRHVLLIENTNVPYITSDVKSTSNEKIESVTSALAKNNTFISKEEWIINNIINPFSPDANLTHRTERVDRETFDKLKTAQEAIWLAKKLLPYGSPDQGISLYGTKGESWARSKMNQTRYVKINNNDNEKKAQQIEKIIKCGSGNCGEFSAVTYMLLANLDLDDNIYRVKCKGLDHSFCVIGELDDNKSIIVDAWSIVPSVHLLSDCMFEADEVLWMHKKGESFPLSMEKVQKIPKATNEEVLNFIKRTRNITNKNDYLAVAKRDPLAKDIFNHIFSENHPMTLFKAEDNGETLGSTIPSSYAEKQQVFISRYLEMERG